MKPGLSLALSKATKKLKAEELAYPKPGPRVSRKTLKSLDGPSGAKLTKILTYWFNRYIRLIDSRPDGWGKCITCQKPVSFENGNACHFISGRFYGTKWLRENVNLGCVSCNKWKAGNLIEYQKSLESKYGKGIIERLELIKTMHPRRPDNFTLKSRIEHYKRECEKIEKESP